MNLKRVLTATLGLPAVVLVCFFGNKYLIGLIILIASIICMHEYFQVVKHISKPVEWIGYLSNIFIILATVMNPADLMPILVFSFPFIILLLFLQVILTKMNTSFKDIAYTLLGILYIPFFLMFLALIRNIEHGKILIGYTFCISWQTDIFAYIIGKNFGKHKISKISPKKSLEGSIAGTIGAVLVTLIYTFIANKYWAVNYSYIYITFASLVLSIISQIGDFAASCIKRFVDVKDYGSLLPGHGGMLDRIDSLLFLAPFAYLIFLFL